MPLLSALGRSRRLAAAGAGKSVGGASGSARPSSEALTEVAAALEVCEAVLKSVEVAASSPDLCLLRGRLLIRSGRPSDAISPLAAAAALLAPDATWRTGVKRLLATGGGTVVAKAEEDELYLAAEMYLGLAQVRCPSVDHLTTV